MAISIFFAGIRIFDGKLYVYRKPFSIVENLILVIVLDQEGDKICIFGFSRGAYTARALAGMIQKVCTRYIISGSDVN